MLKVVVLNKFVVDVLLCGLRTCFSITSYPSNSLEGNGFSVLVEWEILLISIVIATDGFEERLFCAMVFSI